MCLAQRLQQSDAGETRTLGPSVSRQALYHRATALPIHVRSVAFPVQFTQMVQKCSCRTDIVSRHLSESGNNIRGSYHLCAQDR